jgi:hypothetical protein
MHRPQHPEVAYVVIGIDQIANFFPLVHGFSSRIADLSSRRGDTSAGEREMRAVIPLRGEYPGKRSGRQGRGPCNEQ